MGTGRKKTFGSDLGEQGWTFLSDISCPQDTETFSQIPWVESLFIIRFKKSGDQDCPSSLASLMNSCLPWIVPENNFLTSPASTLLQSSFVTC